MNENQLKWSKKTYGIKLKELRNVYLKKIKEEKEDNIYRDS